MNSQDLHAPDCTHQVRGNGGGESKTPRRVGGKFV